MTKLEAVNEILEWIGQPPVEELGDAGSEEYEAETTLDRKNRTIQIRGWFCNTEDEVDFGVPTVKIAASGGTGTFTYAEVVTQAVSGATGYFAYEEGGYVYLNLIAGTFVSAQNITGGSSGATRTGGAYTAATSAKIAYPTAIIKAIPSEAAGEDHIIAQRGGFFWDTEDNTFTFDAGDGLTLKITRLLDFDDLPQTLAEYITKEAAYSFLNYKMPVRDETKGERLSEVSRARAAALQEDNDLRQTDLTQTPQARAFRGDRDDGFARNDISGRTF